MTQAAKTMARALFVVILGTKRTGMGVEEELKGSGPRLLGDGEFFNPALWDHPADLTGP